MRENWQEAICPKGEAEKSMNKKGITSLVTSVYNIVDQLFSGLKLGINGNAATNVIFPVITLITALSLMCGVGASAAMNVALGQGKEEEARQVIGNTFVLMVICGGCSAESFFFFQGL